MVLVKTFKDKDKMDNLKKSFIDLVGFAENLKEKNKNLKPVFADVPAKLKTFATRTTEAMSQVKTKLSFEYLDSTHGHDTRSTSKGLGTDKENNIVHIINWIVTALKHVLEKIEQQGDIITLHTEALADPKAAIADSRDEEIDDLKTEINELKIEVDETRQRGLKGNLIVSSPQRENHDTRAVRQPVGGGRESVTAMVIRMIKEKTDIDVDERDVIACHPMGKKDSNTYILRLCNRKSGSAWNTITEGMRTGKNDSGRNFDPDVNVFINYQLTKRRGALAKAVRTAKTAKKINKYYIDQNGRIKIKKDADDKSYVEVKSEDDLKNIIN